MSEVQEHSGQVAAQVDVLLTPTRLGALELANRIVMAPMTRNRAAADGVPTQMMADHYAARAEAGLIVAEGTWPCAEGQAYCRQPGIVTAEQVAGWRRVTDAVHRRGGRIVLQIMHAGRIGSRHVKGPGVATLGPSDEAARGEVFTDESGMQPFDTPRAMTTAEVVEAVAIHGRAARLARKPASTAWSCTAPVAICRCSFFVRAPTDAMTPTVATSRIACASWLSASRP